VDGTASKPGLVGVRAHRDHGPVKVYAFHCGGDRADFAVNDPFDERVGQKQYSPYFFYMVDHPLGRVLFDTGLHPETGTDFAGRMGRAAGAFPIEMHEDGDVVGQLRKLGLHAEDIDAVVQSHLHFDHAGGLEFVGTRRFTCMRPSCGPHATLRRTRPIFTCRRTSSTTWTGDC
jgi:glyoxylase-like metal-dependent hydrolase (beta-lactamase superfamily II)